MPELVADEQEAQAVIPHHLQGLVGDIGLGVARPSEAEFADLLGERVDARQIVGQRIVVEEELLHLREGGLRPAQFLDDVADASDAIAMTADRLRPQAEGAARFAAAPGVEGDVRVL